MPVRSIVTYDDPRLRKKSRRVQRVDRTIRALVSDMIETMHAANGIGLAAIQIGIPQSVIVVELPANEEGAEDGRQYIVINPQIARRSPETEARPEGCLSVPGLAGEVVRHCAVTVKGLDAQGKPVRVEAEGLLARVFQHEIDHCNGVLFIDHITDPEKLWTVQEGEEEASEVTSAKTAASVRAG